MTKTPSTTGKTLGQQIGVVKIVSGTVTATGADGIPRTLKIGDAVYLDDVIKTADVSFVQIALNTGASFELGRASEAALDSSVLQGPQLAAVQEPDVAAIQAAIQAGQDPTQITPPPAAGPGAGGPGGDDGHSFVVVNFEDQQGLVNSGFNTSGLAFAAAGTLEETTPLIAPPPGISINDVTVNEGAGTASFTVILNAASANTVTVNFTTANGSATAGSDYTAGSGVITFAPGVTSQTISVPITNDNVFEGTENFFVNLTGAVNGDILDGQGVGTILENEAQPSLSINDVTVNEAAGSATFTVTLSGPSATPVTLNFNTANGTATAGPDYTGQTGNLTFAPGVTSQTITVPIINDTIVEGAETYTVNLTNVNGATVADGQGLGTIIDNDVPPPPPPGALPTLSINDVSVEEDSTATFTVTLSAPSAVPVTVNFASSGSPTGGTATAGLDYGAGEGGDFSGALTFAPGVTSMTVQVDALYDEIFEGNETFTITLSGPTNATIADGTGIGTILDGSGSPSFTIDDITVNENAGTATFTVTLSSPSSVTHTVDFVTADGSALAGSDYTGQTGTLSFAPGVTSQTISVPVINDAIFEPSETFTVNLSNATNGATLADNQGVGTIEEDQEPPAASVNDINITEGNTGTFTISLSHASSQTVTVTFATANGTAISGGGGVGENDYTPNSGSVIFAPGETSKTVDVSTLQDSVLEGTEAFNLNLTGITNAAFLDTSGVGTIIDDEAGLQLTINDVTVTEGEGTAIFTVTLSGPSATPVSVDFATADGSALAGNDYTAQSGTLTFAPGVTTQTISVPISEDLIYEGNETFTVNLNNASGATIADPQGLGTLVDNETLPTATVEIVDPPISVLEDGTPVLTFIVSLNHASAFDTVVNFTFGGTATQGTDYTPSVVTGFVTIPAGSLTANITADPTPDTVFEPNETVTVTLTGGTTNGQAIGFNPAPAIGAITNDDAAPAFSINDVTVTEGTDPTITFTVTKTGTTALSSSVVYAVNPGTATTPGDYAAGTSALTGTLTFAPGETSKTITLNITDDLIAEGTETFTVNLSTPSDATISDSQGVGTILDNESQPSLSINDVIVNEAAGTATFTVTLSGPSAGTVTVNFATANNTATAGSDYTTTSGTLTFNPGETTKTIDVPITNDLVYEGDETFFVNLSGASGATVADPQGLGTIQDNDAVPAASVSVSPPSVLEDGVANLVYTISLDHASAFATTVNFTLSGTATQGTDYTPSITGSVTIPAGSLSTTLTVDPTADSLFEANETVTVTLTGGTTNAQPIGLGASSATGTIIDDDQPTLSINDVTVNEGDGTATLTVTLSSASTNTVTVNYATAQNTTALENVDYTLTSGTLTFNPGVLTQTITVPIINDSIVEGTEDFFVNLSSATNASIADGTGLITIIDNDQARLSINDVTVNEAAGTATFTVTLSNPSSFTHTVDFATADGSALAGSDYTGQTGTLSFAPGVTSQTISVPIVNDTTGEPSESFTVNLSNATNGAIISDGVGVGTITEPTLSINDVQLSEGSPSPGNESPITNFTFTVTLSQASSEVVTVNFATANGTATTGPGGPFRDYIAQSGSLTFNPGETSKTITVSVYADNFTEVNETFFVNLSGASNAYIADAQGQGTILNDDSLYISDVVVNEASGMAVFTVTMTTALPHPVTVDFTTADGTARAGQDYLAQSGSLTFAPGVTSQTISVPILNDTLSEPSETFTVNLSNAVGDSIKDGTGVALLIDNDASSAALNLADLLTGMGPQDDLSGFLHFDTQTSPGNTLVTLDTDGAGPALNVPLVTLTGMVVHDLSALLSHTLEYTP